ncbi:MAG: YesL family protein, partial [Lachnospiraceae bacterium]|nr:YesL family protein [Lachnospiraceae bacterium]
MNEIPKNNYTKKINEELYDKKPVDKRNFIRKGLDTFGNIFGLNVCFIIFSLPIFTIGASFTALYSMCIRIQEDKEETILSGYITEFKKNFKQATAAFFIIILYIVIMLGEYIMINNISGVISTIYTYILIVEAVLFCLVVPFVFP